MFNSLKNLFQKNNNQDLPEDIKEQVNSELTKEMITAKVKTAEFLAQLPDEIKDSFIFREEIPGTVTMLYKDIEDNLMTLSKSDLDKLNLGISEAFGIATENVYKQSFQQSEIEVGDKAVKLKTITSDQAILPVMVANPSTDIFGETGIMFGMPTERDLIFISTADPEIETKTSYLGAIVNEMYNMSENKFSNLLYMRKSDGTYDLYAPPE